MDYSNARDVETVTYLSASTKPSQSYPKPLINNILIGYSLHEADHLLLVFYRPHNSIDGRTSARWLPGGSPVYYAEHPKRYNYLIFNRSFSNLDAARGGSLFICSYLLVMYGT